MEARTTQRQLEFDLNRVGAVASRSDKSFGGKAAFHRFVALSEPDLVVNAEPFSRWSRDAGVLQCAANADRHDGPRWMALAERFHFLAHPARIEEQRLRPAERAAQRAIQSSPGGASSSLKNTVKSRSRSRRARSATHSLNS